MKIFRQAQVMPRFRDDVSYDQRIKEREQHENTLWGKIDKVLPWTIIPSSTKQDMAGIDATIEGTDSKGNLTTKTVQLKMRQSGDDVLLETVKPLVFTEEGEIEYVGLTGRDMKADVDMYFCVDRGGILRIYKGPDLKNIATQMTESFIETLRNDPNATTQTLPSGEVKAVVDPSAEASYGMGKVAKVVVFINPRSVPAAFTARLY